MHFVDDDRLEQDRDAAGSCDSSGQFALCEMDAFSVVKVCCCNDNRHLQVFDPFGPQVFFQEIGEIIHAQQTFLAGMDFGQVDERLAGKKLHDFERFSPVSNKGTGNCSCTGARKYVRTDVVKESLQHTQVSNSPDKTAAQCESCMIFQCGHRLSINRRAGGAVFSAAAVCMLIRF